MRSCKVRARVLGCSIAAGLAWASAPCSADARLPAIISDHMVLQHGGARIWGWAEPGERVRVAWSLSGETYETEADPDGEWHVILPTPPLDAPADTEHAGPHNITITAANEIVIDDVLVGEVWVASGQSNMQMTLDRTTYGVENWEGEVAQANYPQIRFFQVQRAVSPTPQKDCVGEWKVCSPETIGPFSAVAYYFGRSIHESQGMPVGLIGTYWGGTVIEAWTSAEGLSDFPEFHSDLSFAARVARDPTFGEGRYQEELRAWERRLGENDPGSRDLAFARIDLDDGDWRQLSLPGLWDGEDGFENFDGFVWYRRSFDAPPGARENLRLSLGPIDDMDAVWINGELIGGMQEPGRWQQPRVYEIPEGLLKPTGNVIAIRVLDTGGAGGFAGSREQMAVNTSDGEPVVSLSGAWRARKGASSRAIPAMPQRPQMHQNRPTALSNAMIAPITPYTIRGAIWYQGESNRMRARQYRALMPALVKDWRRRWGIDMPFYLVQIAPFGYGGDTGQAAELREAQMMAMDAIDGVGVAVTMDAGNPRDIHPKKKKPVGERLARWALAKVYGVDIAYSGPIVEGVEFGEGVARITFAHADGLTIRGGDAPPLFELAGNDGQYVRADSVEIRGRSLVVRAGSVAGAASVRYAWGAADAGALFNDAGLPASSFRRPIP